jgi:hypothetical protein
MSFDVTDLADWPMVPSAGVHMNVVNLGVSAGLDVGIVVLMLLSLLGAAMLMLLALMASAQQRRTCAVELRLMPATPLRTRLAAATYPPRELARAHGATRAPPEFPQKRQQEEHRAIPPCHPRR